MSYRLIELAAEIEGSDDFHQARLLVLMHAVAPSPTSAPIAGIMKLAKMDFLLRYPNVLVRALDAVGRDKPRAAKASAKIPREERNTIEARMIRFRFGPWDSRYRVWLSILRAKGLVTVATKGRTVSIGLTSNGEALAEKISETKEYSDLAKRSKLVRLAVGDMSATKLKNFVYEIAPEIVDMKWGQSIAL